MILFLAKGGTNANRDRILAIVRGQPGINKNQLRRQAGLTWATTSHHLARLEEMGLVRQRRLGRPGILCFPSEASDQLIAWIATLQSSEAHTVLAAMRRDEWVGISEICRRCGLTEGIVTRQLDHLVAGELVLRREGIRPRFALSPNVNSLQKEKPDSPSVAD